MKVVTLINNIVVLAKLVLETIPPIRYLLIGEPQTLKSTALPESCKESGLCVPFVV
jgi:hypothetical protein